MNHEDGENRGDQGLEPRGRHTEMAHLSSCDAWTAKGDVLEKVERSMYLEGPFWLDWDPVPEKLAEGSFTRRPSATGA